MLTLRIKLGFLLTAIFIYATPVSANNNCNGVSFSLDQSSYTFGSASTDPQMTFTVSRSNSSGCDYFVTFGYGGASSSGARRLANGGFTYPFQLYKDQSPTFSLVLKDEPDVHVSGDVVDGSFSSGSGNNTHPHTYRARLLLPAGYTSHPAYVKFGTYTDTYVARLWGGQASSGSHTFLGQCAVSFCYIVPKMVDLSLVSTGQPFSLTSTTQNLAFGVLTTGASKSFDVVLMYNAGYRLKFSSLNNGRLKHSSMSNTVPYTMSVGSIPVGLNGSSVTPVVVSTGSGVSPSTGTRLPVLTTIGSLASAVAGNYSDTVTITVASTE